MDQTDISSFKFKFVKKNFFLTYVCPLQRLPPYAPRSTSTSIKIWTEYHFFFVKSCHYFITINLLLWCPITSLKLYISIVSVFLSLSLAHTHTHSLYLPFSLSLSLCCVCLENSKIIPLSYILSSQRKKRRRWLMRELMLDEFQYYDATQRRSRLFFLRGGGAGGA